MTPTGEPTADDASSPAPISVASPSDIDPGRRGTLDLPGRVIGTIAGRSLQLHGDCLDRPGVEVRDDAGRSLHLDASIVLPYPDEPLAPLLDRLRIAAASDVRHQTGRDVARLDLFVDRFETEPRPTPRVI